MTTLSGFAEAQTSTCAKWNNHLTVFDLYPSLCPGGSCPAPDDLSFTNRRNYYSKLYSDSPDQACATWKAVLYPNVAGTVSKGSPTSTGYTCRINGTAYAQSIELDFIARESCCERTIVGPHADVTPNVYYAAVWNMPGYSGPFPPADGVAFSNYTTTQQRPMPSQRTQILARNQLTGIPPFNVLLPFWLSDMYQPGPKTDALQDLETAECAGGILETADPNDPCAAQVDHIIPRVDVYGCKCGSNSFSNALLISRALNIKMSNNCSDETRNAILDAFDPTIPPPGTTASAGRPRGMQLADSGMCTKPSVWAL